MSASSTSLCLLKPPWRNPNHLAPFPIRQHRTFKRRRIKPPRQSINKLRTLVLCSHLPDPFQHLLSHLPSPSSLEIFGPILGLASGLTLYLSQFAKPSAATDIGEWILFSSPTPFNRFVLLRCPTISFEGGELLQDVNERLVQEDRHFVRLNSGRIQVRDGGAGGGWEEKLVYQRVCVNTEDGGVVSLDWPANLDLKEEHGLDTTLLLVPGTAEGSMDANVRAFVCDALRRGFFPVVMNPRGCAGSPLTTARLFTAADSDDIYTAVQFINKARPWTTLMGVGWGYGANMLTKYLAEVGDRTPLTAATCINNPFDLEEATRCSPYHIALDQKLTGGLINILQSNKELFQGRAKGFDVEKALLAKSVRDFEKAISVVSYGFEKIEDFYSESSTHNTVANVKVPVLFIQSDDGTVPLFSIPRSLIAENPFTSLLLCSCVSSSVIGSGKAAVSWCQNLTVEWLTAVELGLLKGRHPLLKDVDVTINPSNSLALVEGRASDEGVKLNKPLDLTLTDVNGYTVAPVKEIPDPKQCDKESINRRDLELNEGLQETNGTLKQTSSVGAEVAKEDMADPADSERGQVLQTAQVVMNMLDVTMPGTLSDEEKGKVLTAVGQGETVMKALQDAVPEDVRGKLTTAASGILQTQRTNLKLDGLLGIGPIPDAQSGHKSKIHEKVKHLSGAETVPQDPHPSDQMKRAGDFSNSSGNNQPASEKSGAAVEVRPSEYLQKSVDLDESQGTSCQQGDASISARTGMSETGHNDINDFKAKAASDSDSGEKVSETVAKPSTTGKTGGSEEVANEYKVDQDGAIPQAEAKKESNNQNSEERMLDSSTDQNKTVSVSTSEEALAGSPPNSQPTEREGSDNQKRENKTSQPSLDESKPAVSDSSSPTFTVAQALDALTGMDDSTQVAVNSVFGVIEDMITQLEEEKEDESKILDRNEAVDHSTDLLSKNQQVPSDHLKNMKENGEIDSGMQLDTLQDPHVNIHHENSVDPQSAASTRWERERIEDLNGDSGGNGSQENIFGDDKNDVEKNDHLVGGKLSADYIDKHVNRIPLYITAHQYEDYLRNEYFNRYLPSKIPNTRSLDLDTTTALLLEHFPEDGQWKLLEQQGNIGESLNDVTPLNDFGKVHVLSPAKGNNKDDYIEPSYIVLDAEKQWKLTEEFETTDYPDGNVANGDDRLEELMQLVKDIILDALRIEVRRKLSATDIKEVESSLARDVELVANTVSLAVRRDKFQTWCLQGKDLSVDCTSEKVGTLNGEHIVMSISAAVMDTSYLRKVLPVGVIIGSSLAALRRYFNVAVGQDNAPSSPDQTRNYGAKNREKICKKMGQKVTKKTDQATDLNDGREEEDVKLNNIKNDSVVVGAVTAVLGASALLVQQQTPNKGKDTGVDSSKALKDRLNSQKAADNLDGVTFEKDQNNIVASLAEKAMSVAGPVVPTKEDGEVDQERLVAILADLGQKGGMLRLVGKIALLWGGIRGAMSLTDRLISFLRIAERPLYQRILAFIGMVLVLWSPVVVPLLPTLVQSWTTGNPSRFAEFVSILGLYTAVMILVVLWGRRIRGYEDPLAQYGLDITTLPKVQNFLKGFIGGIMLVLSIQFVNALLGCVSFSWPPSILSSSSDAVTCFKVYGKMIMLATRGFITATGIVLVEELLFRAWLPEEIATDLGYHQGIIISGLIFSLSQRSLWAIPGLWLLSLALAGIRQRSEGSLAIPIGLRAGILASSFILQTGGFLTHRLYFPLWVTGTHPFQPFSGVVGIASSLLLAILLYPRQTLLKKKKLGRTIQE